METPPIPERAAKQLIEMATPIVTDFYVPKSTREILSRTGIGTAGVFYFDTFFDETADTKQRIDGLYRGAVVYCISTVRQAAYGFLNPHDDPEINAGLIAELEGMIEHEYRNRHAQTDEHEFLIRAEIERLRDVAGISKPTVGRRIGQALGLSRS